MKYTLSQQELSKNPLIQSVLLDNNSSRTKILSSLLRQCWKYRVIFPSQTCLALSNDICRATVNRQLALMEHMGWITKKRRYDTTCVYTINPLIIRARRLLWHKFSPLKTLSLFLLHSAIGASLQGVVTPRENYLFINPPLIHSLSMHPPKKRETVVNDFVVSPTLRLATEILGLSKNGQLKLSMFGDTVLRKALVSYAKCRKKGIDDPAAWVYSVSRKIAERKGISFNKESYSMLCGKYHVDSQSPLQREGIEIDSSALEKLESLITKENPQREHVSPPVPANILAKFKDMQRSQEEAAVDTKKDKSSNVVDLDRDEDYEQHLINISKDKSNPEAFIALVRRTDLMRRGKR